MSEIVTKTRRPLEPTPAPASIETLASAPTSAEPFPSWACVGRAVQYCTREGVVVPGILESQPRTDKTTWNVRIWPVGASVSVVRSAKRYSPVPKPDHWNPLPPG